MYIFENNIYYQTDVQSSSWRLTSSGQEGVVFNGIADWLYEGKRVSSNNRHTSKIVLFTVGAEALCGLLSQLRLADVSPFGIAEEVLHTQAAHWWSPDGARLAYLTINNSLVPNMLLPRFTGSLYPRGKEYPYPKVAFKSPDLQFQYHSMIFSLLLLQTFLVDWKNSENTTRDENECYVRNGLNPAL